jgi:UDP-2,3-diacylglucosamine pyrophosphatase LpxH
MMSNTSLPQSGNFVLVVGKAGARRSDVACRVRPEGSPLDFLFTDGDTRDCRDDTQSPNRHNALIQIVHSADSRPVIYSVPRQGYREACMKSWVFVSDVHLNANWTDNGIHGNTYPFEWLQAKQKGRFVRFLDCLDAARTMGVVLLGDIFDNWIYPVDEPPPTIRDIVSANREVFAAIARLQKRNLKVAYLRGNHDMTTTESDLRQGGVDGIHFCQADAVKVGPVHAEHGHAMCLFNARDNHTKFKPLPLGYFISRAIASASGDHNVHEQTTGDYLRGLLDKALLAKEIENVVLDIVLGSGQLLADDTKFVMPENQETDVGTVRTAFKKLYENWKGDPWEALLAEKYGLGKVVGTRFSDTTRVVVCGHTHGPCFEGGTGHVYVNSGGWIRNDDTGDYVEIFPNRDDNTLHVQLRRWNGKDETVKLMKESTISGCPVDEATWGQVTDVEIK